MYPLTRFLVVFYIVLLDLKSELFLKSFLIFRSTVHPVTQVAVKVL